MLDIIRLSCKDIDSSRFKPSKGLKKMITAKEVKFETTLLCVQSEEWCLKIGSNAAILKSVGFNDAYIKKYVGYHLNGIGENKKEILEAEALARGGYIKATKAIKSVDTSNLIVYGFDYDGNVKCCYKDGIKKVAGAAWLLSHIKNEIHIFQ